MRRSLATCTCTMLVAMTALVITSAVPATAQVAFPAADFSGYSTGTAVHVDAAQLAAGGPGVANAEVAFSGATVASQGTGGVTQGPGALGGTIVNEMNQVVQPALPHKTENEDLPGNRSFGRGSGLEVGLLNSLPTDTNQVLLAQRVRASAPPTTDLITKQVGPVNLDPVAYASLLRGQAAARWENGVCILGEPVSEGLGYAADAQILNTGTAGADGFSQSLVAAAASSPERRVSQSRSTTRLVPQVDGDGKATGAFGLSTETRMTIAPVTLFKGQPTEVTIEFLGEWVLRATATGLPGGASVFYGPGTVTPQTPVLRILPAGGSETLVTLQQLLGDAGINPVAIPGVADIAIGEAPRRIGGAFGSGPEIAGDGTLAGGAVDVVRLKILENTGGTSGGGLVLSSGVDLRLGHIESRAQVPVGGIRCALPVAKVADKQTVQAGDSFIYTIAVTNPFADCELTTVRVEDLVEVTNGVRYSITGTSQPATVTPPLNTVQNGTNSTVVFDDIGPIAPKSTKTVTISVSIAPNSADGVFTDTAKATGNCATGNAAGSAKIVVPASGEVRVVVPGVGAGPRAAELPLTGAAPAQLPRTGGDPMLAILGLGLLALAAGARRLFTASTR